MSRKPRTQDAALLSRGTYKANFRNNSSKYFQHVTITRVEIVHSTHCYSPFRWRIQVPPPPTFRQSDHSSFCSCLLIGRNWSVKHPPSGQSSAGQTNRTLYYRDCFDHVDWDMFRAASDDDLEAYSDTVTCFIRKLYRWCSSDQNNLYLPQPKTGGLTVMFDQPCQRGHLAFKSRNTWRSENKQLRSQEIHQSSQTNI